MDPYTSARVDALANDLLALITLALMIIGGILLLITYYRIANIRDSARITNRHLEAIHTTLKEQSQTTPPPPKKSHFPDNAASASSGLHDKAT